MKTAIYVRVSTTMQADRDSIPMQIRDLKAYSEVVLNCPDYEVFEDAGFSGKNTDRPAYQEMMTRVRKGEFTHVLVWKLDRISRNLLDFLSMYDELKELGVTFVSKNDQFDTSSAMGEAMLRIILVFAELERKMTSERVAATMKSRAASGKWNGGRIPYGYRYHKKTGDFTVHEKEADVVRFIFTSCIDGASLQAIAHILNGRGDVKPSGHLWSPQTVRLALINPFYCGAMHYNTRKEGSRQKVKPEDEWVVIPDHHPAIVDETTFRKAGDALRSSCRSWTKAEGRYTHIFGGKIYCQDCGRKMTSHTIRPDANKMRFSTYHCPTKASDPGASCKHCSDAVIGEIFLNLLLHIVTAQDRTFQSKEELQDYILQGAPFSYIEAIEEPGLSQLYDVLAKKDLPPREDRSEAIAALQANLDRERRALRRLEDAYLYDDRSMTKADFVATRMEIAGNIDAIAAEIANESADADLISDRDFLKTISDSLLGNDFSSRNYVYFKNRCVQIGTKSMQTLVDQTVKMILASGGKIAQIAFTNGLTISFKRRILQ